MRKVLFVMGLFWGLVGESQAQEVWVFLTPECPLCRSYSRTLRTLSQQQASRWKFHWVNAEPSYTNMDWAAFRQHYWPDMPPVESISPDSLQKWGVSVVPSVRVVWQGRPVYQGAIDNWVIALGKKRKQPTAHYLAEVLAHPRPDTLPFVQRKALGCLITHETSR